MYYYCTCSTLKSKQKDVNAGRTPFREVEVDSEGVCNDCGHYAVAYFDKINPKEGKLYNKIMEEVIEIPKNLKNTRKVQTTKYRKRGKKRGTSDSTGEDKNGNLDA